MDAANLFSWCSCYCQQWFIDLLHAESNADIWDPMSCDPVILILVPATTSMWCGGLVYCHSPFSWCLGCTSLLSLLSLEKSRDCLVTTCSWIGNLSIIWLTVFASVKRIEPVPSMFLRMLDCNSHSFLLKAGFELAWEFACLILPLPSSVLWGSVWHCCES